MTFKQYTIIYEVLSNTAEEMKHEENTIKELYNNDINKYEKDKELYDEVYKKLLQKRIEIESICDSIENMEI